MLTLVRRFLLTFGRGSINITDDNPYGGAVKIDPRYLSNRFDRIAQAATIRFTRRIAERLGAGLFAGETAPGLDVVPANGTLQNFAAWAADNSRSNFHSIGVAAMLPLERGGSVDSNHSVYGVQGLRVADASVLPIQLSSHLMQ